jgi:hypothetical protein
MDNGYYEVRVFNGLELAPMVKDFKTNNVYYQRWGVGAGVKYKIMCKKNLLHYWH